ncbi:putative gustatory receptor 28b [Chelonus insularis]|uniref:putative gustatory receptor 28b n=1 Tax=Chelonus insularis TaxID=460826 RepID=UPI00158A8A6D|nr:putative gustatory receptor 28b [Chelonus insularis]
MINKINITKKWQPFRATNFLSLMWPCLILWKIHGVFPYKFKTPTSIIISKPVYIFSIIIIIFYLITYSSIMYHMDVTGELDYDSVPAILQANSYLSFGFWIIITAFFQRKTRTDFLEKLAKESVKIPAKKYRQLSRLIHLKDLIGILFVYAHFPNIFSSSYPLIGFKAFGVYTTIIVYLVNALYTNCVLIIHTHFQIINEKLIKLKFHIENDECHLLRRIYHVRKNPLILMEIKKIIKEHNDVCNLVLQLNCTFSLQMIAIVTLTFAEITFSLYFYILKTVGFKDINLEKQIWYSYFITSVTYYSGYIITAVGVCEHAKDEADKTGIIVHEILNNTIDKQIAEELQIFSLQLLHRKTNFLAKGLALDYTLLTSIAGGVTTYLLILIQFLITTNSCQMNNNSTTTIAITTMANN